MRMMMPKNRDSSGMSTPTASARGPPAGGHCRGLGAQARAGARQHDVTGRRYSDARNRRARAAFSARGSAGTSLAGAVAVAVNAYQPRGAEGAQGGAVTVIQRFGGGLNLNIHFHTLVLDGIFGETEMGSLEFHPAEPPTDADVARLLATVRRRVQRLLARRGLDGGDASEAPPDPFTEEAPALAGISSASVQGHVALGPRAGARVLQIGREPNAPWVTSRGPCQAHLEGFDLHANLAVRADDREGLERLCRYVLRPPVAQDRLELTGDGRVLVLLKGEWSDGTTHLLFEPVELLEKLAALTPRPRINLVLYHGVLAPHARWRARAVAHGGAEARAPAEANAAEPDRVEGCPDRAPEVETRACREPATQPSGPARA